RGAARRPLAGGTGTGRARGPRLHRGSVSGHPSVTVTAVGRITSWCHGPAAHQSCLGMVVGPRLCRPGRCQGPCQGHTAAPHLASGRGRVGRCDLRREPRRCARLRPGAALMAVTGRSVLVALFAVGAVLISGRLSALVTAVALALLALLLGLDALLAASPGALHLSREGDTSLRLGVTATGYPTVPSPTRRPLRGRIRDAWPPRAHSRPSSRSLNVPSGERRRIGTELTPTRRGDARAAGVTVRSIGPLGLAGRQRTLSAPWAV